MKLSFVIAALLLLPVLALTANATTNQPTIHGTVYYADGSPAPGATVRVTLGSLLFNTTTTDEAGQYSVVPSVSFDLPQAANINATLGNQTNRTLSTLVDGAAPYTIDVHMNAPPRYNVTIHTTDINTGDDVASALIIVATNPYGTAVEMGSAYTNSTGIVIFNLSVDSSPFRFTAIKSGYPATGIVRAVYQDTSVPIQLGTVPIPNYNLTVVVTNKTSGLPISGVAVSIDPANADRYPPAATGITNASGITIIELASASYWVMAHLLGYSSNETLVNLDTNKTVSLALPPGLTAATPLPILPIAAIVFLAALLAFAAYRRIE